MLNLIPRPRYAKELEGTVSFSQNTKLIGAFCENFDVLKNMLPNGAAPENTLMFVEDASVAAEGYRILCENGDITVYAKTENTDFQLIGTYENVTDYFTSRIKRKKFKDIQLKFYSKTRFSLETVTLECFIGGYIKR